MRKLTKPIAESYRHEPVYKQEKIKLLVTASFYIFFVESIGLALHLAEGKAWTVIAGDALLLAAAAAVFPLVYHKRFDLASRLILWTLLLVLILHNPLTDYLYAGSLTYYRVLETVIFLIIIVLTVTSFMYQTRQILFASIAGVAIICLHYLIIIRKFYGGKFDIHSLSLVIGYLLLFFIVCIICFYLLGRFHLLIGQLEAESTKVKQYNLELEASVDERTEALGLQNQELKKVNEELDRFVYSISHDLRAPLTSVLGLIEVARHETDLQQIRTYLDLKERSITRLDKYIRDVISFYKNARLTSAEEETDLQKLLEQIFEPYNLLDNFDSFEKKIQIRQSAPLVTDTYRLSTILKNLVSNAIRYATPHRRIPFVHIVADITAEKAVISVEDNGRGIAAEHLQQIFAMFFRASHETVGSGLGLYIVKETVEKLQGKVHVTSTLGKGSTFTLEIPNKKLHHEYS